MGGLRRESNWRLKPPLFWPVKVVLFDWNGPLVVFHSFPAFLIFFLYRPVAVVVVCLLLRLLLVFVGTEPAFFFHCFLSFQHLKWAPHLTHSGACPSDGKRAVIQRGRSSVIDVASTQTTKIRFKIRTAVQQDIDWIVTFLPVIVMAGTYFSRFLIWTPADTLGARLNTAGCRTRSTLQHLYHVHVYDRNQSQQVRLGQ